MRLDDCTNDGGEFPLVGVLIHIGKHADHRLAGCASHGHDAVGSPGSLFAGAKAPAGDGQNLGRKEWRALAAQPRPTSATVARSRLLLALARRYAFEHRRCATKTRTRAAARGS